mmetsp:Transcript_34673/g.75882  ORF Transcript_34673/g.75882 Transcript_34673/m.75882 type:complete len:868 (-) Transcript_34673:83-2686(-)
MAANAATNTPADDGTIGTSMRKEPRYSSLPTPILSWKQRMREYRHNPCIMAPTTALLVTVIALLSLVGLALRLPIFVLGLFLSPLMRRAPWFVEFIYPSSIARSVHIALMQWGLHSKVGRGSGIKGRSGRLIPPQHSRSVEQRTEVVRGRVYVHPIPQLLDNVGYLIVCCPPPGSRTSNVLGIMVDCGDASSALAQVELIRDTHYSDLPSKPKIEIHAVLNTHKHHDHTAGNRALLADAETTKTLKSIVGGAIENVPYCTYPVKNGQRVPLPKVGDNDMSELVEIECIAVPSHTRGSIVYALRNLLAQSPDAGIVSHIFTGDAMFSGGGGVAFESDVETARDKNAATKNRDSPIKLTAGRCSIERCFAEVLFRSATQIRGDRDVFFGSGHPSRVLMFPGHEYTADLLLRQLDPSNEHHGHWTKLPPAIFFETAAQYFISSHRRTLPKNSRLLTVPSSLDREIKTNPHFRALKKRGEHLISAVRIWYRYMSKTRREEAHSVGNVALRQSSSSLENNKSFESVSGAEVRRALSAASDKTPSTDISWTMDASDINRSVFTTMYTSDLDSVINDLHLGRISGSAAATRLRDMQKKLDEPVVTRRPIPGTLPSEKNMYLAVVALALLGSPPCGMTYSDGMNMNLPPPLDSSDQVVISRGRIVSILALLGLLNGPKTIVPEDSKDGDTEPCIVEMIEILWSEAHSDSQTSAVDDLELTEGKECNGTDLEDSSEDKDDEIELGLLKMTLNGAVLNQPSWFSKYCLPCGSGAEPPPNTRLTPSVARMRRSGGELVRHDVHSCPMCRDVVGCVAPALISEDIPHFAEEQDDDESDGGRESLEERLHHSPLIMEGVADDSSDGGSTAGVEFQVISSL